MEHIDEAASKGILEHSRLGVLCMSDQDGAYGIPLYFKFDGDAVYFHCHAGMKDEYLNGREVCLVVSHIESESIWESVQVFGQVRKLSISSEIDAAKAALYQVPFPPAEGNFPSGKPIRSGDAIYYAELKVGRISGMASGYKEG